MSGWGKRHLRIPEPPQTGVGWGASLSREGHPESLNTSAPSSTSWGHLDTHFSPTEGAECHCTRPHRLAPLPQPLPDLRVPQEGSTPQSMPLMSFVRDRGA